MPFAREARDLTRAECSNGSGIRNAFEDSYVLADTNHSAELVFPGPRMQLQTEIQFGSRRYLLRDLFVVNVTYLEDGKVFADHSSLPIHGYGETLNEAIESFCEAFDLQWRSLVDAPVESLTPGGKRRRDDLRNAVTEVVESNP